MADQDGKAVAIIGVAQGTSLANIDYGEDAGGGFENTTAADFKTPWLRVLDAKSKQVEAGLPGAKAGRIVNTITNALYDSTLFVPAITEAYYVEWKPRNQGGGGGKGFVGVHKPTEPMVVAALADLAKKGGKFAKGADGKNLLPKSPAGFDLVETFYVHGLQIDEETGDTAQAMIAFSSTGIPVYQGWLAQADSQKTGPAEARKSKPLFAHVYRLGTAKQEGNGNSWWNFTVRFAGEGAQASVLDIQSDIFTKAKAIKAEVLAGTVKVDHAGSEAPAPVGGAGGSNEEIPF